MTTCCRRQCGVTLVELIVVVVILGIVAATGLPAFTSFLRNTEVRSASEAVYQGLQLAKAEAVRRNQRVRVVFGTDTSWTVSTDGGSAIQSKPAKESGANTALTFTPSASRTITFSAFGRVTSNADGTAPITRMDFSAAGQTISRSIKVEEGGKLNMCDPTVTSATSPLFC